MVIHCDYYIENQERVKWLTHYASNHQILLVGDGDFSFSLCLARAFGSAYNILTSSLDSHDDVIKKYKEAKINLMKLYGLGANVLHGVDATRMKLHTDLRNRRFDRIIFNFPHAGFHGREDDHRVIEKHKSLMHNFFSNAKGMLRPDGEIHVNHKTKAPFSDWNLEILASTNSLVLIERVEFNISDYPLYKQKRGSGKRCDEPFHLGKASTFKFQFCPSLYKAQGTASWSGQSQIRPVTMPYDNELENGIRYNNEGLLGQSCHELFPLVKEVRPGLTTHFDYGFDFNRDSFGRSVMSQEMHGFPDFNHRASYHSFDEHGHDFERDRVSRVDDRVFCFDQDTRFMPENNVHYYVNQTDPLRLMREYGSLEIESFSSDHSLRRSIGYCQFESFSSDHNLRRSTGYCQFESFSSDHSLRRSTGY